jgi:two-component system OmpR family response regulator
MPPVCREPAVADGPDPRPLIAVVDDDPDILDMLRAALAYQGYRSVLWQTGTDAQLMIRREQPDLVILDLWLEERTTGETVVDVMRLDAITTAIPVLIISGHVHELRGSLRRLQALGCHVLAKPFTLDDLYGAIATLIGPAQAGTAAHQDP